MHTLIKRKKIWLKPLLNGCTHMGYKPGTGKAASQLMCQQQSGGMEGSVVLWLCIVTQVIAAPSGM